MSPLTRGLFSDAFSSIQGDIMYAMLASSSSNQEFRNRFSVEEYTQFENILRVANHAQSTFKPSQERKDDIKVQIQQHVEKTKEKLQAAPIEPLTLLSDEAMLDSGFGGSTLDHYHVLIEFLNETELQLFQQLMEKFTLKENVAPACGAKLE